MLEAPLGENNRRPPLSRDGDYVIV